MRITLTSAQWESLVDIVNQGRNIERSLGKPVEVINGDLKIEITADETVIELED